MRKTWPYGSTPAEGDRVEAHSLKRGWEPWRVAGRLALRERRLWPAALLVSLGLSESWCLLFGWGPQWVGERVAERVRGGAGKGFPDTALLVLVGLIAFFLSRAMGYLGETVLVAQVAFTRREDGGVPAARGDRAGNTASSPEAEEEERARTADDSECIRSSDKTRLIHPLRSPFSRRGKRRGGPCVSDDASSGVGAPREAGYGRASFPRGTRGAGEKGEGLSAGMVAVPSFREALRGSGRGCPQLALALLPWDAARVAVISLASLLVLLWRRWDPHLRFVALYLLALLLWFLLLLAVYVLLGIPALLAARQVVINGKKAPEAWREGFSLFLERVNDCLLVWLRALAADIAFLALAWLLAAFLTWAAGRVGEAFRPGVLGLVFRAPLYGLPVAAFLLGQAVVQSYKSSLWTVFFLSVTALPPVVS